MFSEQGFRPLHPALHPKLKTLNRLHLTIICAVEIPFSGANVGMAHQSLNGSKIIPIIQKGRGKGVPHHVRMNLFLDQRLLRNRLDEAVNSLGSQALFLVGSMLPQCLKERMSRFYPIPGGL